MFAHANSSLILAPVLVSALLTTNGCTSTHRVSERSGAYSRITEEVTGEPVQVFLRDGRTLRLTDLYVGVDSTMGAPSQGDRKQFPTSVLRKIEVVDHGTGFWHGAGIGLGTGLGATLVSVGAQKKRPCTVPCPCRRPCHKCPIDLSWRAYREHPWTERGLPVSGPRAQLEREDCFLWTSSGDGTIFRALSPPSPFFGSAA